ncbi:Ctr copper transporter [Zychaea mexicana]|uniref:Ctr copper transporter n=1 Tax=Zychaea mexicana TaxID=64656 RepID=UPI0022FF2A20|nr:Ctr copper transporter [Zychaea mexicana]KAI9497666.1 Ctr copper transporter [Zychaea mexicana]
MDMSGGSSTSDSMDHSSMSMGTFHWSSSGDAIWLDAWLPSAEPAYIGACFGLLFIAILSRSIFAIEAYFNSWANIRYQRLYGINTYNDNGFNPTPRIAGLFAKAATKAPEKTSGDLPIDTPSSSTSNNIPYNYNAYPEAHRLPRVAPFNWPIDTIRSFLTALASFVSYLLMMVVMTGNGGYLLVIVVGVFIGEMIFGRFRSLGGLTGEHDH